MRFRAQKVLAAVMICFIVFVSYKILEPEIHGRSFRDMEMMELERLHMRHTIDGKRSFQAHTHNNTHVIQKQDVIEELINMYRLNFRHPIKMSPWKIAKQWVTTRQVHPAESPEMGAVLHALATRKIISADVGHKGTQLKMSLALEGGQRVVFKPKWFSRSHVIKGDPYAGEDRHNGEIVAFHLGRIMELRRTPLVIGRTVNLVKEVMPVAQNRLLATFFMKDNNTCFYGQCYYCKGPETGVCADGDHLEGAVVLWLPDHYKLKPHRHPWARTYSKKVVAKWEQNEHFCEQYIMPADVFVNGPRLMDLVDTAVLDYLIGNADRHHYETLQDGYQSMVLIMDNGKSFGNPHTDERSILAPLYQCCRIRESTWLRLLVLQEGVLSAVLGAILEQDPIAPVLSDLHMEAIDRRLVQVLNVIKECTYKYNTSSIFIKNR